MRQTLLIKFIAIVITTCLCLLIVWKFNIIDLIRFPGAFKTWKYRENTSFVTFSQSGKLFLTSSKVEDASKTINSKFIQEIRKLSDGEVIQTLKTQDTNFFAWKRVFSLDDSLIAAASYKGGVQIWRVSDGELLHTLQTIDDPKMRIGFIGLTPDGSTLVTKAGKAEYLPPRRDVPNYTIQIDFWNLEDGIKRHTLSDSYDQLSISNNGQLLAACRINEPLALYRVSDGTLIQQFKEISKSCFQPQFSPDGKLLAVLSYYPRGNPIYSIHIYNIENGELKYILRARTGFHQEKERMNHIAFSHDSSYLAVSYGVKHSDTDFWGSAFSYPLTSHGRIRFWRMEDGKQIQTLRGHRKGSSSLVFSPDGGFLASSGQDNTIRFWKMPPRNYGWLWLLGIGGLIAFTYWQRAYFIDWINR